MMVAGVLNNASVKMNGATNSRDGDTSHSNTSFGGWCCTNCVIVVNVDGFKPALGLMCPGPAYMDLIVECNAINHYSSLFNKYNSSKTWVYNYMVAPVWFVEVKLDRRCPFFCCLKCC